MTPLKKPKRPLSAYNVFFRAERAKLLETETQTNTVDQDQDKVAGEAKKKRRPHRKTHGKIGFQALAKFIAQKWKSLDSTERAIYEGQAVENLKAYYQEMEVFKDALKKQEESKTQPQPQQQQPSNPNDLVLATPPMSMTALEPPPPAPTSSNMMNAAEVQSAIPAGRVTPVEVASNQSIQAVAYGQAQAALVGRIDHHAPFGSIAGMAMDVVIKQQQRDAGVPAPPGGNTASMNVRPKMVRPKRPLSAYNLFFRHERANVIGEDAPDPTDAVTGKKKRRHRKTHGKIGFQDLARHIATRWKSLDPDEKAFFDDQAAENLKVYWKELEAYKKAWEQYEKTQGGPPSHPPPVDISEIARSDPKKSQPGQHGATPSTYGLELLAGLSLARHV